MPKPLAVTKPLLIGQSPSKYTQDRDGQDVEPPAFSGLSGNRLAAIMGVELGDFLNRVEAINVFDRFPGRFSDKGDVFPMGEANQRAALLLPRLIGRTAILAGRNVASAFGIDLSPLEVTISGGTRWALLPHPSGINQWWNSVTNCQEAKEFLRRELGYDSLRQRAKA